MKMGKRTSQFVSGPGFTIIELLVVISIITLLLGFLATGMQAFRRRANDLRQKAQFHGIEVGLELFYKDYDDYPDSWVLPDPDDDSGPYVFGAQHLAEALLGRDLRGHDPKTWWCAPMEEAANDTEIYARDGEKGTQDEIDASKARRWGPYIELKKDMNVLVMEILYGVNCGDVYPSEENPADSGKRPYRSPVFVDIFRQKKATLDNGDSVRVGTPVLYYKAKTSSRLFREQKDDPETEIDERDWRKWIYNYEDNRGIIELGTVKEPAIKHLFDESHPELDPEKKGVPLFYKTITNLKVSRTDDEDPENSDYKPFNPQTFILVSAGRDGIFGTKDDITNFDY
jgi:prepilin-type N-terminal cleavage/methylation domain-containing protein